MILLETERGLFLAILVFLAVVFIITLLLIRKITLKKTPLVILLTAFTIYWLIKSLGSFIVIGEVTSNNTIDFVPFSTFIRAFDIYKEFPSNDDFLIYYLIPYCKVFVITFVLGCVWGIILPILVDNESSVSILKNYLLILFPIELLINLCYLLGISYKYHYDTARYFILAFGVFVGWSLFKAFNKHLSRRQTND